MNEVTMLTKYKYGLQWIDKLLKEIMNNQELFGGKTVVLSGDFRQTLPVVPHETNKGWNNRNLHLIQ